MPGAPASDTLPVDAACDGAVHGGSSYAGSDGVERWDMCGCAVPPGPRADADPAAKALADAIRPFALAVEAEDAKGRDFEEALRALGGRVSLRHWRNLHAALAAWDAARP